jgi:hypothetical protein
MSRKVFTWAVTGAVCLSIFFAAGCGPQADLALKFNAGDKTSYIIMEEDSKDFKFEQPSLDKVRFEPRTVTSEITFLQEIEKVDEKGAAIAKITITAFKYFAKDKGNVKLNFDSSREDDKKKPLAKLIGKSYKIKLASDGSVKVLNAKNIRKAVTGGQAYRVANALLNNKVIQRRHGIRSLPDTDKSLLSTGDSWTRVETPQLRLMVPKAFEKTYTFNKVTGHGNNQVAIVNMNASESPTTPVGALKSPGGIGLFSNMFDTDETYTGQMVLELATGKVAKFNENFVTTYTAAEPSVRQKPDKGPDVLTIEITYSAALEMLD